MAAVSFLRSSSVLGHFAAPAVGRAMSRLVVARVMNSSAGGFMSIPAVRGVEEKGERDTLDWRLYFVGATGEKISPWHEIPLQSANSKTAPVFNFVGEIPKNTRAKMEIVTDEDLNPIKQDVKKGKLRLYHEPILWNYGCLPQTWEDPECTHPDVPGHNGDGDPIDVVEIGERTCNMGDVYEVKVLGCLSMIDGGELDWKVIALRKDDPKASLVNDIQDVEEHFPGEVSAIREWFRNYKIPDGKPPNAYGHDEKALDAKYTYAVIEETHEQWKKYFFDQKKGA